MSSSPTTTPKRPERPAVSLDMRSTLVGSRLAIPHMTEPGGSISHTASVAVLVGGVLQTSYDAVKAAVVSITKSVVTRYGPKNIRCNAIAPGALPR